MSHLVGFVLILLCIVLETAQQLMYRASGRTKSHRRIIISCGIGLYFGELIVWLTVLRFLPLGIALPLLGANYAAVALGSQWFFGEKINGRRWAGIVCIIGGFVMISRYAP